ncbi:RNA 2',3'-cyclic phosphodiesterase [Cronobacter turicensis]|uniref:RNA 2',3'-cyclic phosphodiesterase n=4 Tax=Cronobacter turicensis TaxID=413502 RepID=A0A2T7B874_9ENTR|nr:RNA 2',3'-cyclic phosphodiesterase [Cronobacter turicensis]MEB8538918.1 RNA 2',3'-cyclic phosphodiesterase [Cronobacter sakazakii]EGT4494106.1 RNA 2',3'-cyclic phosphodiesterase [Cronobacter turicensis]EKM0437065.1 RNA 2',3'-cyclic phosphodiesterase [Cronobacter turicensis]EKM0527032.1 RNA 2',3'-cyclic phosphodiesterase [Cronobacter turicensis]EKM0665046.1 RNA 2',3'-cyclic phosphodiesterase [Cronobacter turicensis]
MSDQKRLFFALPLPADLQQRIIEWRAASFAPDAGRPIAAANLHITLAFLGDVSAQKQRTLSTLAGRIQQPGFTLALDDAGHWPRSQVVWLGSRQPPRGLLQLANLLRAQAARSGCPQSAQPFHPHVTLLRNAQHPVRLPPPGFGWQLPVREFVLYESRFEQGRTRYQPLQSWSLNP